MSIKVIYHANCTDGFCSAYLFWCKYKDKAEYIPMSYGQELDFDKFTAKGTKVYILDFSFSRSELLRLAECVAKVVVLDHHKTAQEELSGDWPENTYIEFDMERSGAMMTWDYLHPNLDAPLFVRYVQDRDLWQFKLPDSRKVSAYMQAIPFGFKNWDKLRELFKVHPDTIVQMGQAILMKVNQQIRASVKNATLCQLEVDFEIFTILAVNTTVNFSEVAGKLAEGHKFGIAWFIRSDGKYQYSLRSKNFDVSTIAKAFGGGGHAQAAGFESDELLLTQVPK